MDASFHDPFVTASFFIAAKPVLGSEVLTCCLLQINWSQLLPWATWWLMVQNSGLSCGAVLASQFALYKLQPSVGGVLPCRHFPVSQGKVQSGRFPLDCTNLTSSYSFPSISSLLSSAIWIYRLYFFIAPYFVN